MTDYEEMILARQDSEADDCAKCPYLVDGRCNNECEKIVSVYNPIILKMLERK